MGQKIGPREQQLRTLREERSFHRVPNSMTDEEAQGLIARRVAEKKEKTAARIAALKASVAAKDAEVIAKANEKRKEMGLAELPPTEKPVAEDESDMAKKKVKKTKPPKPPKPSKPPKKKKLKASNGAVREGSKAAKVAEMLLRPAGCTNKDVLKATGWPTVSMPAQAKMAGLKLRREKTEAGMRYFGSRP